MNFGEALKRIRESRGMNQSDFAKLLKTSRQTINRYEKSMREPNIRTAATYAAILGISLEELTGEKEQKPAPVSEGGQSEIAAIFDQLDKDNQAKLFELARLYLDAQRKTEEKQ